MKKNDLLFSLLALVSHVSLAQPGTYDPSLNIGNGANSYILETKIQPDAKIVIAGDFTQFNSLSDGRIDRINANGSVDLTYLGVTGADATVRAVDVQADAKILIGGDFTNVQSEPRNYIARLDSDGSLDYSFLATANGVVHDIVYLSSGKIIVVGEFTTMNGSAAPHIARLNNDGTLDGTFTPGLGTDQLISCVAVQTDGKLIISGDFSTYNGSSANNIARLNVDGTHDLNFWLPQVPNGAIYEIAPQADGQVVIAGSFTLINGVTQNRISRLNANGNVDFTFQTTSGSGISGFYVKALAIQPDGKILAGGYFTGYNGTLQNNIVRLTPDGAIDPTFTIGSGPNSEVRDIELQTDGKIIISGYFSEYNGFPSRSIARLNGGTVSIDEIKPSTEISLSPNPSNGNFTVHSSEKIEQIAIYSSTGEIISSSTTEVISMAGKIPAGMYLIQVKTISGIHMEKLIID